METLRREVGLLRGSERLLQALPLRVSPGSWRREFVQFKFGFFYQQKAATLTYTITQLP